MNPTDTSEARLESLICRALTGSDCMLRPAGTPPFVAEPPAPYGGVGWLPGDPADYDREYCVDLAQLAAFLRATQPKVAEALDLDSDSPTRRKFLARLQGVQPLAPGTALVLVLVAQQIEVFLALAEQACHGRFAGDAGVLALAIDGDDLLAGQVHV